MGGASPLENSRCKHGQAAAARARPTRSPGLSLPSLSRADLRLTERAHCWAVGAVCWGVGEGGGSLGELHGPPT